MASIIKVDQLQSDTGTVNVASNIAATGNFTIAGDLQIAGLSSPSGTMNISSDIVTTGNVSVNAKATIDSSGRQFSVIDAGTTLFEEYKCRAWVNFNGTGTVAIRASGNVTSITDNGTGDYTVNFTTAMPDANYSVSSNSVGNAAQTGPTANTDLTTASVRIVSASRAGTLTDHNIVSVSVFR